MRSDTAIKDLGLSLPSMEATLIREMLHNSRQQVMLVGILPGVFSEPLHQLIVFVMKQMYFKKIPLTESNILLYYVQEKDVRSFRWKFKIQQYSQEDILEVIDLLGHKQISEYFDQVYDTLADVALRRYAYLKMKDIAYHLRFFGHDYDISSIAKSIYLLERTLKRSKVAVKRGAKDGIRKAALNINKADTTIPSFSRSINKYITGWTRGYPNALLARSSHGKSTFIFNEVTHKIKHNIVGKIAIISPEEDENTFWRRGFSSEFNIDSSLMRAGLAKITEDQIVALETKYTSRVDFFREGMVNYKNVIDLLFSLDGYEMIIIDHVTAIDYPGNGNALQNLAGGIISLVHRETDFLSKNKQATIINVNQVREKDIEASIKGYWKAPSYTLAYGNSTTYVACREWVTLYYPYRDLVTRSHEWMGINPADLPTMNDLHFMVEKSSFGTIGAGVLQFIPEYARIMDRVQSEQREKVVIQQEELFINEIKKKHKN